MTTRAPIPVLDALRQRLRSLDGTARRRAVLPFGIPAIDARLPGGGLALGALHEAAGGGNGAIDGAAAALFAAGIAARTQGRVLWCVSRQDLFAPALAQAGLAPDRVIFVDAGDEKTVLACFEEGLREHSGVGAVVAEVARLSMSASRRLQLAAEGSGAIGIAIRRLPVFSRRGRGIGICGLTNGGHTGLPPPIEIGCCRFRPLSELPEPAYTRVPVWGRDGVGGDPGSHRGASLTTPIPSPQGGGEERASPTNRNLTSVQGIAGKGQAQAKGRTQAQIQDRQEDLQDYFAQPTAAVTRWRVSALPSAPLPVAGVGRSRWRLELIRCRGGEAACFDVEACDAQGRLALPADLVHGPGQEAIGRRRAAR